VGIIANFVIFKFSVNAFLFQNKTITALGLKHKNSLAKTMFGSVGVGKITLKNKSTDKN
jgi:hypothetical protein